MLKLLIPQLLALLLAGTLAADEKRRSKPTYPPLLPGAKVEPYKQLGDVQLNAYVFQPADWQTSDKRAAIVFFFGDGGEASEESLNSSGEGGVDSELHSGEVDLVEAGFGAEAAQRHRRGQRSIPIALRPEVSRQGSFSLLKAQPPQGFAAHPRQLQPRLPDRAALSKAKMR